MAPYGRPLTHAERTYKNTAGDSKKKSNATARSLGLSTGTRPKEFDAKQMYYDYFELVRKKGLCRYEAIERITSKYYDSMTINEEPEQASLRHLIKHLTDIRRKIQNEPCETIKNTINSYLKGFLPDSRSLDDFLNNKSKENI